MSLAKIEGVSTVSQPTKLFGREFQAYEADARDARLFFLHKPGTSGGQLPPIVLLHGFPQNSSLWHRFVQHLPDGLDVIIPDLPGYGKSTKASSSDGSARSHSKREMAKDILSLVERIYGSDVKIIIYGHDRGARVAYRMALDHPQRLVGMAALDIVPGIEQFGAMRLDVGRHRETLTSYHWLFLAQPAPLPETLIAATPAFYIKNCIDRWAGPRTRGKFTDEEYKAWIEPYERSHDVIVGSCRDYQAGATIDLEDEEEDTKLAVPSLILYSHGLARHPVEEMWARHVAPGTKHRIAQAGDDQDGHFIGIEALEAVVEETLRWLRDDLGLNI